MSISTSLANNSHTSDFDNRNSEQKPFQFHAEWLSAVKLDFFFFVFFHHKKYFSISKLRARIEVCSERVRNVVLFANTEEMRTDILTQAVAFWTQWEVVQCCVTHVPSQLNQDVNPEPEKRQARSMLFQHSKDPGVRQKVFGLQFHHHRQDQRGVWWPGDGAAIPLIHVHDRRFWEQRPGTKPSLELIFPGSFCSRGRTDL